MLATVLVMSNRRGGEEEEALTSTGSCASKYD
jgi:hypothetical protein